MRRFDALPRQPPSDQNRTRRVSSPPVLTVHAPLNVRPRRPSDPVTQVDFKALDNYEWNHPKEVQEVRDTIDQFIEEHRPEVVEIAESTQMKRLLRMFRVDRSTFILLSLALGAIYLLYRGPVHSTQHLGLDAGIELNAFWLYLKGVVPKVYQAIQDSEFRISLHQFLEEYIRWLNAKGVGIRIVRQQTLPNTIPQIASAANATNLASKIGDFLANFMNPRSK